jgi:hypothetical protein
MNWLCHKPRQFYCDYSSSTGRLLQLVICMANYTWLGELIYV